MEVWNAFVQTRLSFKPKKNFKLFSYLKLISTLITQFKLSAVDSYDVAFRSAMAAQRKVAHSQKTVKWEPKKPELANIHLTEDQHLPPPKCFSCNSKGHVATVQTPCRRKAQHRATKGTRDNIIMSFGIKRKLTCVSIGIGAIATERETVGTSTSAATAMPLMRFCPGHK